MRKILITLCSMIAFITACSTPKPPGESFLDETAPQIYQEGITELQDKNFSDAIRRFEAVDIQYPLGTEAEGAQFYLIYAYYMKEEYQMAMLAADRYIRLHPTNPHVDYAYYMKGMANYFENMGVLERLFSIDLANRDLTQMQKAYQDFAQVVTLFPNSQYAPAAQQFLIYLRNMMANHELYIAQYYYEHKAYVAAANRANIVVAHYQGAPAVAGALDIMVKSYRQLGLTKQEQDTLRVLQYNYPQHKI
jgi:outer membrane protein assembly factor BamD